MKKFIADHGKLDVLVNNAGEMFPVYEKTKSENLEINFATNVVGPFALTTGLIPLLKKSVNKPRVVRLIMFFPLLSRERAKILSVGSAYC